MANTPRLIDTPAGLVLLRQLASIVNILIADHPDLSNTPESSVSDSLVSYPGIVRGARQAVRDDGHLRQDGSSFQEEVAESDTAEESESLVRGARKSLPRVGYRAKRNAKQAVVQKLTPAQANVYKFLIRKQKPQRVHDIVKGTGFAQKTIENFMSVLRQHGLLDTSSL